jgi:hypothetical protein
VAQGENTMLWSWSRRQFAAKWAIGVILLGVSAGVQAGKPVVTTTYSDVYITVGTQTFGFSGAEKSFSQSATGGRIVFDLTQLGTPGFTPSPQVDTGALEAQGNHWEIQSNLGTKSYLFVGTCASETYTTTEGSATVRHLNLNCKDLDSGVSP